MPNLEARAYYSKSLSASSMVPELVEQLTIASLHTCSTSVIKSGFITVSASTKANTTESTGTRDSTNFEGRVATSSNLSS